MICKVLLYSFTFAVPLFSPIVVPINTADADASPIVITFKYWNIVVETELAAIASADKRPKIPVWIGVASAYNVFDRKDGHKILKNLENASFVN